MNELKNSFGIVLLWYLCFCLFLHEDIYKNKIFCHKEHVRMSEEEKHENSNRNDADN